MNQPAPLQDQAQPAAPILTDQNQPITAPPANILGGEDTSQPSVPVPPSQEENLNEDIVTAREQVANVVTRPLMDNPPLEESVKVAVNQLPTSVKAQPTPASNSPISTPAPSPMSSGNKEAEPIANNAETTTLVELHKDHELEPEVEGWLEKVERSRDVRLPAPIQDDQGNIILDNTETTAPEDKIVLPLTHEAVNKGVHAKVTDSARWLATWCLRLIKKFGNQVQYASKEGHTPTQEPMK